MRYTKKTQEIVRGSEKYDKRRCVYILHGFRLCVHCACVCVDNLTLWVQGLSRTSQRECGTANTRKGLSVYTIQTIALCAPSIGLAQLAVSPSVRENSAYFPMKACQVDACEKTH